MPADRLFHQKAGHSHKVNLLTDLEYRVWTQYLLSADDFGVMRATAVKLQSDNDHLAQRPAKQIQRCIDVLIQSGLVRTFDHQAAKFVYQRDWQDFQKVTWPAKTINPPVPPDELAECSEATRLLFSVHPGAKKVPAKNSERTPEVLLENSERTSEELSSTRAGAPAKRLTANGSRLEANGSLEEGPGETAPADKWLRELQDAYPQSRVTRGARTEHAFVDALLFAKTGCTPAATWALMCANLTANKASHEWLVKRMIPSLEKYLRDGLWLNVLPADAPTHTQPGVKTSGNVDAIKAFIARREA